MADVLRQLPIVSLIQAAAHQALLALTDSLRKHAYSNILKNLPPKKK